MTEPSDRANALAEIAYKWRVAREAYVAGEDARVPEPEPEAKPDGPPPPLCVFCNAPWTDDMMAVFAEAELEDGYYGDSHVEFIDVTVDVTCSSCERLVYRKELRTRQADWSAGA